MTKSADRQRALRSRQKEQGIVDVTVTVPIEARPKLRKAAQLMKNGESVETALRRAAGGNEMPLFRHPQPWRDEDLIEVLNAKKPGFWQRLFGR